MVSYQGTKYEAIWWSTGASPDIFSNVWANRGICSDDGGGDGGDNGGGDDINLTPKAGFSASVSGLTVSFTNTSTDDYEVVSSSWVFGDGSFSNSTNPTHTFAESGEYTVTLTVADAGGLTAQVSGRVRVERANTGGCSGIDTWSASAVYLQGTQVTLNNQIYRANWWVQGDNPQDSDQWGPWTLTGQCN
jgi:chitodextrinase